VATTIVFFAVLHRYGTSSSIDTAKWLDAHGMAVLDAPFRAVFRFLASMDVSWAQEVTIYMFIWMAKFGAAYGVRTGIHVGVDVLVMRMEPARAKKVILFGLLAGAFFTAVIANFGAHFTWGVFQAGTRSNDLEIRMWIVYMAIPAGSALMCFRFLQVAWYYWRKGELPHHDVAHVEGIDENVMPAEVRSGAAPEPAEVKPRDKGRVMSIVLMALPFVLLGLGLMAKEGMIEAGGGLRSALVFGLLLSLMMTGMPISIALGLTVLSFMYTLTDVSLDSVAMKLFTGIENFEIMAIPFFILAGNFLTHGGVARRMINFATSMVGHWHGGLGLAAVLACALFAAVSGSSPASVVAIGSVVIPAMVAQGFPPRFGAGVVTTSGALGILIPPSIAMVLYSVSTNTSVGKLFVAGVIPGIMLATMLGITTWYRARKGGYPRMARAPWSQKFKAGRESFWGLMLIIIVMGGIYTGIFTPTEAAAMSAVYAFFIAVYVYTDLKLRDVARVLLASANMSAMLLYIITNAVLFSFLMTSEQIPQTMADWLVTQGLGPIGFLLLVNLMLLAAGNVMEPSSIILITAPILFPVAMKLGIDPIHFGILITVNMEVGLCHPPVGLNLYVASGIAKMGITELTIAVWPWLLTMLVFLAIITYVPEISLFLPRILGM
jgi:C4-dicarboxylate transporter DctM subunit